MARVRMIQQRRRSRKDGAEELEQKRWSRKEQEQAKNRGKYRNWGTLGNVKLPNDGINS